MELQLPVFPAIGAGPRSEKPASSISPTILQSSGLRSSPMISYADREILLYLWTLSEIFGCFWSFVYVFISETLALSLILVLGMGTFVSIAAIMVIILIGSSRS
jgi:hypothetical protein